MNQFECIDCIYGVSVNQGRAFEERAEEGIDFVIDGRPFRELLLQNIDDSLRQQCDIEHAVTLFEVSPSIAVAVLMGEREVPEDDDLQGPARVPLLGCLCGDLDCGAVLARVTTTEDTVTWSDWTYTDSWNPALAIRGLGPVTFERHRYRDQLDQAAQRSFQERLVSTVTAPDTDTVLDALLPRRSRRHTLRKRLAEFNATVTRGTRLAAHPGYEDYLDEFRDLQRAVADTQRRPFKPETAHRATVANRLCDLAASPHAKHLPSRTFEATTWLARHLSARNE